MISLEDFITAHRDEPEGEPEPAPVIIRTAAGARIHALLRSRRGREQAITAPQIAGQVGMLEREVRAVIAAEFCAWVPESGLLLSLPGQGFFFATEAEEIRHRDRLLISLWLQSGGKVLDFQAAARAAGFGGLVLGFAAKVIRFIQASRWFRTFLDESQPEHPRREAR